VKGVVHFKKRKKKKRKTFAELLLIIYSPPCHPRCPRLSLFSRKEIKKKKFLMKRIQGFSP